MIAAFFARLWAKVAGWLALAGAVIATCGYAFVKGHHEGAQEQAAKDADKGAKAAQDVQASADKAVQDIVSRAANEPPADTVKRDDFDTTD